MQVNYAISRSPWEVIFPTPVMLATSVTTLWAIKLLGALIKCMSVDKVGKRKPKNGRQHLKIWALDKRLK